MAFFIACGPGLLAITIHTQTIPMSGERGIFSTPYFALYM